MKSLSVLVIICLLMISQVCECCHPGPIGEPGERGPRDPYEVLLQKILKKVHGEFLAFGELPEQEVMDRLFKEVDNLILQKNKKIITNTQSNLIIADAESIEHEIKLKSSEIIKDKIKEIDFLIEELKQKIIDVSNLKIGPPGVMGMPGQDGECSDENVARSLMRLFNLKYKELEPEDTPVSCEKAWIIEGTMELICLNSKEETKQLHHMVETEWYKEWCDPNAPSLPPAWDSYFKR